MIYNTNRKIFDEHAIHSCENCGRECPGVAVIAACAEWMQPAQRSSEDLTMRGAVLESVPVDRQSS